MAQILGKKK